MYLTKIYLLIKIKKNNDKFFEWEHSGMYAEVNTFKCIRNIVENYWFSFLKVAEKNTIKWIDIIMRNMFVSQKRKLFMCGLDNETMFTLKKRGNVW